MLHLKDPRKHIKKQIQEAINMNDEFAGKIDINRFRHFANKFIDATTYGESERFAREFIHFILRPNSKGFLSPILESLNNLELYGKYEYRKQRLHYTHQVNVFLLGLFLYHEVPIIQEKMNEEIVLTTSEIEFNRNGSLRKYRYSGDSKFDEFLLRWKLASLSHDIGYGISLFGNDENKINEVLVNLLSPNIYNLNDLYLFESQNLLSQLDSSISEMSIENYMQNQYENPFKGHVYYDHGLISSLIFLRLMNQEYANHRDNVITCDGSANIIWDESVLSGSILQVAIAIAFHNLDQYSNLLQNVAENKKIFNLDERPLAWLLKLSDIIQEWDKPEADEKIMSEIIKPPSIQISFLNGKLSVNNFPSDKLENVQKTISDYTYPSDLIEIIDT